MQELSAEEAVVVSYAPPQMGIVDPATVTVTRSATMAVLASIRPDGFKRGAVSWAAYLSSLRLLRSCQCGTQGQAGGF